MLTITTQSKKIISLDNPKSDQIDINDIAHALSHLCRFGGHSTEFYSVAQHSLYCAQVALLKKLSQNEVRWALLHDATEAYLVDVPRDVKAMLKDYKPLEQKFSDVIAEKFGLSKEMPASVKTIDNEMLLTEAKYFGYDIDSWELSQYYKPLDIIFEPTSRMKQMRNAFLILDLSLIDNWDEISKSLKASTKELV